MSKESVVIVGMARTPIGSFQGALTDATAPQLGATAIREALRRSGVAPEEVGEVLMGCVLPAGLGQAPARQAALGAGLPYGVPCTTVNKMCGSGLKTIMLAADIIAAGGADIVIAGGMESMTNAPYLLPKVRAGLRLGHSEVKDHMFLDGLEDAYDSGCLMGVFAEATAKKYAFTREEQDAFAIESLRRAKEAVESCYFEKEIAPVKLAGRKGETIVSKDEGPLKLDASKIPTLKPAFDKAGTVTAANASSISDGAAAVVLMRESEAARRGLKPLARVAAQATHSQEPAWFTTAPVGALKKIHAATGWTRDSVGLYEINEAFACVTMAAMREHELAHEKVNIHGGACALGHPIGASGARILITLLAAMEQYGKERGVAALCIGGGEAVAVGVERV